MSICKNCHIYRKIGEKCWYYWENKSICSQFQNTEEDEPTVTSEENI